MGTIVQYLVRQIPSHNAMELEETLNDIGNDGWRLVAVEEHNYLFVKEGHGGGSIAHETSAPTHVFRRKKETLTDREKDVVELLASGHPNRRIAEILGLKEQSVKNLVTVAMRKLKVENRTQLALKFFEITS